MEMKMQSLALADIGGVLVSACATSGPGASEGAEPPKLVLNKQGKNTWDNPGAFGPVPRSQQARGHAVCATLDTPEEKHEATGYHSKAVGADGKPIAGGGYFCVIK